jgi:hypothetical protein
MDFKQTINSVYNYKITIGIISFVLLTIGVATVSCKRSNSVDVKNKMIIKVVDSVNDSIPNIDIVIYEIEKSIFGELWWKLHKINELRTNEQGVIEISINKEKRYSIRVYQDGNLIEFGDFEASKLNFNKVYEIKCLNKPVMDSINLNDWLEH